MSAVAPAADATIREHWLTGSRVSGWVISLLIFLSGFVIVEPAPYDVLLIATVVGWSLFGLRINRFAMPMFVLLVVYLVGGYLSVTQLPTFANKPEMYMVVTTFLAISSVFWAFIVAEDPGRRLNLIRRAYVASAVVVALIGTLAYFNLIPGADAFKLYDRAKGTFQDPNVFGPFLILPMAFLVQDILRRRLRNCLWPIVGLVVILVGVFLSFSRAAWGMAVFAILATAYFAYATEIRQMSRMRIVGYLAGGGAALAIMLAVVISLPAVHGLFEERAQVVQSYDDAPQGRFERQKEGFFLIMEKPLGIGPFTFAKKYGEDEHNMWLKGFTTYGWLGGFAYIALAAWTLGAAFPLLFKPRPWQGVVQCTYVVFVGHLLIHNVIDNDHWRHLFLIYGMLWGAIAAEKTLRRARVSEPATTPPRTSVARVSGIPRARPA